MPTVLRVFAFVIWIPALLATNGMSQTMPREAAIPAILNLWVSTGFMTLVCLALARLLERKS